MSLSVHIEKKLETFVLRANFDVENVTTALLGASGSGKSVTLKCIAGIMTPDRGTIVLDGVTLFDSEKRINLPPQKRRVGYLFQQYALFPNMTVEQNIRCGIRSKNREEKQQLTAEHIRRFRLEGMEKKYPVQLSGGQQQRVALARILASEPKAILLDEPFSALDSYLKWDLELELSDLLKDFQGPILWVSHELGECYRNCQAACVMENGVNGDLITMDELLQHPTTPGTAQLAGCRNFLPAHKVKDGVCIDDWNISLPIKGTGDTIKLAIPDAAISLQNGTIPAKVFRVIHDIHNTVLVLQSENANASLLRVLQPETMQVSVGDSVTFSISAENCWYWNI